MSDEFDNFRISFNDLIKNYLKLLEFVKTLQVHCSREFCINSEFNDGYAVKNNEIEERATELLKELKEIE